MDLTGIGASRKEEAKVERVNARRPLSKFFKSSTLPSDFNTASEFQKQMLEQEAREIRARAASPERRIVSPEKDEKTSPPTTPTARSEAAECASCAADEFCRFHSLKELFPSLGIHPSTSNAELASGGLPPLSFGFSTIPQICAHLAAALSLYDPNRGASATNRASFSPMPATRSGLGIPASVSFSAPLPTSPKAARATAHSFSQALHPTHKTLQPSKTWTMDSKDIFANLLSECMSLEAVRSDTLRNYDRSVLNSDRRIPSLIALFSFMLKSLNSLCLHHSAAGSFSRDQLRCLCPSRSCPVFLIRLLSGTNVLLSALEPVFRLQDALLQTLALKFVWRLFHMSQYCAPRCSRFSTLKLYDVRSAHTFWSKICYGIPTPLRESAFNDFIELITDRTDEKDELDSEGQVVKVDLFRSDIRNAFLISHTFELLRGTTSDFQLKGLTHLLSALLARSSTVYPIHHIFTCSDRELGVLTLLSDMSWRNHEDFTVDGDIAHYAVGYLSGLLGSLLDSSFLSTARHTMTVLNSFGPSTSSARRVFIMRQVLAVAIGSFKEHSGGMLQDVGGAMWVNWMHLLAIVLEFILYTGFNNPLGSDHFPNREDYITASLLPPPPDFHFESTSRKAPEFPIRPWNFSFHGPLKLHLGVRPNEEGKWEVVWEDLDLLRRLEATMVGLGLHHPINLLHSPGQKQVVTQALQRGNQLYGLVQAVLKVFTDTGIQPPQSSFAILRHPRHFKQAAAAEIERTRKTKSLQPNYVDDMLVAQATHALKAAQIATNIEAVIATKDSRAAIAYLQRQSRDKLHDLTNPEDAVQVVFQGTLLTSTRGNPKLSLMVQLRGDSLLYTDKTKNSAGAESEKTCVSVPLLAIRHIALDVPNTEAGMFSFALVGPPEAFVAAAPTQALRDEWVNLISFATAHCRLEQQAQGDCLEGLHVLVSSTFRDKSVASRAALSSGGLYHYRRLFMPSSSADTVTSTVVMRPTDLPNCADCQSSFSVFNHRQHCPRCKRGFCQKCLSRPKGKEFGLAKVCNPCYAELTDVETSKEATRNELLLASPTKAPPKVPSPTSPRNETRILDQVASLDHGGRMWS